MRGIPALVAMVLIVSACGEPADSASLAPSSTSSTSTTTTSTTLPPDPGPDLMGLALHRLVTDANTYGPDHRFSALLVQTSTDDQAGTGLLGGTTRPLTEAEQTAIETALAGLSDDIRWIDDASEWRTDELMPVIPGSAIIGVGDVAYDDAGALIPVSLWCGGLCGTWFTWRAESIAGVWEITGTEGPVAIS